MTRQEALEKLQALIPSFRRKYIHWGELVDKDVDRSWLYRDDLKWDKKNNNITYPEVIPADYLIGLKGTLKDRTTGEDIEYETVPHYDEDGGGRKIALEVMDFGYYGNTHKYGTLKVSGVEWRNLTNGYTTMCSELDDIDPHVSFYWNVDLFKIIDDNDLSQKKDDWDCYNPNEATQRFESLAELYCTAAYVALLRYQGPIYLFEGSWCCVPSKKDYLLTVDENDNVEFYDELKWAIRVMEEGK